MIYTMKPLACDPQRVKGMSERLIVSHYENNYGGAVKRLNQIAEQLAGLDVATAPNFVINGLKREELIATNSMILHELFFAGLGEESGPAGSQRRPGGMLRQLWSAGGPSSWPWARRRAAVRAGCCSPGRRAIAPGQPMGGRSHDDARRRAADPGARHVRAFLPPRLRRQGRHLCRHLHAVDPMGERRRTVRPTLQAGLIRNGEACHRFAGNTPQIRSYHRDVQDFGAARHRYPRRRARGTGARRHRLDEGRADLRPARGRAQPGGVHRFGFPRSDLKVTLDGIAIKPALALGSWLAFEEAGDAGYGHGRPRPHRGRGQPGHEQLAESGIEITALHNHLLRAQPATMYMHVEGHGDAVKLAQALRLALEESQTPIAFQPRGR